LRLCRRSTMMMRFVRAADGTVTTISVPGFSEVTLRAINDEGVFVGSYGNSGGPTTAFYGTPGDLVVFSIPGATSTILTGINDAGQLVGTYTDSEGTFGFITSATPEPSSLALGFVGLLGIAAMMLKRRLAKRA
jgi:hypothetical protein